MSSTWYKYQSLHLLVNIGFQVLFHSPPGVLFTFPSLYFFAIAHQVVFRLGGWSLRLPARFLVSRSTLDPAISLCLSLTGLSPCIAGFPNTILLGSVWHTQSSTPNSRSYSVWPLPISLAATLWIDVSFSSCRYLDVSVHDVPPTALSFSCSSDWAFLSRVPPFGYLRLAGYLLLTVAFRSLSRPSSAPGG